MLLRDALFSLPLPVTAAWHLAFVAPPHRAAPQPGGPRPPATVFNGPRECATLTEYQMGCLAYQMSLGGFDGLPGRRCGCETDGRRCIARLR